MRVLLVLLVLALACVPANAVAASSVPIGANDNRAPAGTLRGGTLAVKLEIVEDSWQPDHSLPAPRILAFAESGKAATVPGPLIRVPRGTEVRASITNRTGETIWVYGLGDRPGQAEPLQVAAHATVAARFRADTPGSYYYYGSLRQPAPDSREGRDSELHGALIVDAGRTVDNDRVFVIGAHLDEGKDGPFLWTINGRSWPDTERLTYTVGEAVRWRWINTTTHRHPMHLHGNYFSVTSSGDNWLDVPIAPAQRHLDVTHVLRSGDTMALAWSPARPGNWLFHCHVLFHVMPENRLSGTTEWYDEYADLPHDQHMTGLVLGMRVLPASKTARHDEQASAEPHRMTLRIGERAGVRYSLPGLAFPGVGYALDEGPVTAPGPPLILERGKPVEITINNGIAHASAVHWHGIELESYYDGVPHFGGDGTHTTPLIAPGGSFTARFVPPRAGTFIYHTHFNDFVQLAGGLYGALIVVEAGTPFDAATDHVYLVSIDGPDEDHDPALINGRSELPAQTWHVGQRHRLRLIGISPVSVARVRLTRDDVPVVWRALAKDGADLAPQLSTTRPADLEIQPGETHDFEVVADAAGPLRLEVALVGNSGTRASAPIEVDP